MEILIKAAQLLLSLSLLIVLHEMGHFLAARWFNTRVEKFYLFFDAFGFSLFKLKRGETEYGLGWLPLGGYVKISGMIDESMDKEQLEKPAQPWEFRSKPAWQRLIIMLGGVIVNFFLGFLIYSMVLFTWGSAKVPVSAMHDGMHVVDSLMMDVGFQTGDKIVAVNDYKPVYWDEVLPLLLEESADATVTIERDGVEKEIQLPEDFVGQLIDRRDARAPLISLRFPVVVGKPSEDSFAEEAGFQKFDHIQSVNGEATAYYDQFKAALLQNVEGEVDVTVLRDGQEVILHSKVDSLGRLGFSMVDEVGLNRLGLFELEIVHYGFWESFPAGLNLAWKKLSSYVNQIKLLLTPGTGAYKGVGGFASIGNLFPGEWSWEAFWSITAFLSLMLAFMNILPIPALDGGHVLFTLFEMVTGRKPGDRFLEYAQYAGLIFVLLLILLTNGNDIYRYLIK